MHVWAKTFRRSHESLTMTEAKVLEAGPTRDHRSLALRNDISGVVSSDAEGMREIFGDYGSFAGPSVTPTTAMKLSAVYRCTALIAGAVACLPLPVYTVDAADVRQTVRTHALWPLVNAQPTARFSAATWWEFVVMEMLNRGDSIAVIVRDKAGNVKELIPVTRDYWVVFRHEGRLAYYVNDPYSGNAPVTFDQDDILHFSGFGFNGLVAMSVIRWAAFQSIGTGIAQEEFAGKFFANGANQKIALISPDNMSVEQLDKLRAAWGNKYAGAANAHNPLVLYGGMDIKTISISNEDSQLLESRRFTVEDIARAYGVPPFMIGHNEKTTSWGSGVESMGQGFLTFTLQPHLNRIQQEINRKIFRTSKYFVEFKTIGLLAADVTARAKYQREAIGGSQGPGWLTINEVRRAENMPPIDSGEELYYPQKAAEPSPAKDAAATGASDE